MSVQNKKAFNDIVKKIEMIIRDAYVASKDYPITKTE